MRFRIFLLLLLAGLRCYGQTNTTDSLRYYSVQVAKMRAAAIDSLRKNSRYQHYRSSATRLLRSRDSYRAVSLFTTVASASFKKLNSDLAAEGFPTLSGSLWGFGLAYSSKKRNTILELALTLPAARKSSLSGEHMKVSYSEVLHLELGRDLIRGPLLNLYPFAGIALRGSYMAFEARRTVNPSPANFSNVILSDASVSDYRTSAGCSAGLGADIMLTGLHHTGGVMLYVKGATSRAIGAKDFNLYGTGYPSWEEGRWTFTAGVKLFAK